MDLFTQYSLWWLIPCILLGALYAFILYRKEQRLEDTSAGLKNLLALLRTLVIAGIAFLLLGPFFRYFERETQKPVVLIAQDNSSSILLGPDSASYRRDYITALNAMVESLGEDFEVQTYTFDKELSNDFDIDYSGKQSDIAKAITDMVERNVNRNIGAVILATDGIYNKGMSPGHVASSSGLPFFTIAMGDTTVRRDLVLENVAHNRLAYLGNDFPLEVLLKADRLEGRQTVLTVRKGGAELFRKTIDINDEAFVTTIPATLNADKVGRQRFDISLSTLEGELSTSNNYRSIYIDVLDSRQKVLMLYGAPHPDIAAVRNSIESNDNYEVQLARADRFNGQLDDYDLLILQGIPTLRYRVDQILQTARNKKVPVWVLGGLNTRWADLSDYGLGVKVQSKGGANATEASPSLERGFSLFSLSQEIGQLASKCPPLHTTFADFESEPSARVLFSQRIGVVETDQPLWVFSEIDGHKTSLTCGEGLWRWRLIDHSENKDHQLFDELISRTIQFLATKEDRRQFRVYSKNRFDEDQRIILEAELYNQSFELINDPEVTVTCTDQGGNAYEFVFSRTQTAYYLDAGKLPVGQYSYVARVRFDGKESRSSGEFLVAPIQVESVRTTADHQLLYRLSNSSGGTLYYPSQVASIADDIKAQEDIVPVIYSSEHVRELIESRWLFFLFLGLLAIEWFVRKFKGSY